MIKILAITNTIEFQNRATFEAINDKYGCLDVLVKRHLKDYFKKKTISDKLSIRYIHSLIPASWQKHSLLKKIECIWLSFWIKKYIDRYSLFLFCNTHVAHMATFFEDKKRLALFIDPYTLMSEGESTSLEKEWVNNTDAVLCTSKALAEQYIDKYLNIANVKTYYWPNTADLIKWQGFKKDYTAGNPIICGYSGNMNEMTIDLPLVEKIIKHNPDSFFRFAGKINFKDERDNNKMKGFFKRNNVNYLGFIPYKKIPEEVNRWDICLMLDPKNELSRYVHHNKIYQYLALGKPVVSTLTHDDYQPLSSVIYQADDHHHFLINLKKAIAELATDNARPQRLQFAEINSASTRADQFITIINTHYKENYVYQKNPVCVP